MANWSGKAAAGRLCACNFDSLTETRSSATTKRRIEGTSTCMSSWDDEPATLEARHAHCFSCLLTMAELIGAISVASTVCINLVEQEWLQACIVRALFAEAFAIPIDELMQSFDLWHCRHIRLHLLIAIDVVEYDDLSVFALRSYQISDFGNILRSPCRIRLMSSTLEFSEEISSEKTSLDDRSMTISEGVTMIGGEEIMSDWLVVETEDG